MKLKVEFTYKECPDCHRKIRELVRESDGIICDMCKQRKGMSFYENIDVFIGFTNGLSNSFDFCSWQCFSEYMKRNAENIAYFDIKYFHVEQIRTMEMNDFQAKEEHDKYVSSFLSIFKEE